MRRLARIGVTGSATSRARSSAPTVLALSIPYFSATLSGAEVEAHAAALVDAAAWVTETLRPSALPQAQ